MVDLRIDLKTHGSAVAGATIGCHAVIRSECVSRHGRELVAVTACTTG
jgi:hypothetical protein